MNISYYLVKYSPWEIFLSSELVLTFPLRSQLTRTDRLKLTRPLKMFYYVDFLTIGWNEKCLSEKVAFQRRVLVKITSFQKKVELYKLL